ncbi:hypothetical protein GCM10010329_00420 [Streptomyces spiroverticillatus]|uniref:DUF397 domain-containing protein n=1 Tax=Streptomyces finlayi TaxID=67296 RepID=A0A918WS30_9ACTN|nr:DUF397 domain-containing protein [Streptomyces finlayi]GGZ84898.1 hypothetical protein GCM10010329_00420 [Streptomyces spiroverticillatus]GHC76634.1 hypothetical protein GCM10010334_00420 [Streptomyces finlayi]
MIDRRVTTEFKKPSASQGGSQDCVEVAHTVDGGRAVRDTKDRGPATQFYGPAGWNTFVAALKEGALGRQTGAS